MSRLPASRDDDNAREIYDGRLRLGTIRQQSKGHYEARRADDTLIGGFPTNAEAFSAIVAACPDNERRAAA
jgi:hypothetical protein